jgi:hypothetical protein
MKRIASCVTCIIFVCFILNAIQATNDTKVFYSIDEQHEPLWMPPHVVITKNVTPSEINLNRSGTGVENATVTLTVKSYGEEEYFPPPSIDVVLEIDTSASMNETHFGKKKIDYVKDAATSLLDYFNISRNERAAIVEFSSNVTTGVPIIKLVQNFTSNYSLLKQEINSLQLKGNNTPFYNATIFSTNYANLNHWPPNQTHPHQTPPPYHHHPCVFAFTDGLDTCSNVSLQDCLNFTTNSYNNPPPGYYWGFETVAYMLGFGNDTNQTVLQMISDAGGGKSYFEPSSEDVTDMYNKISATLPIPIPHIDFLEIKEVLPPHISYNYNWSCTPKNNVIIKNFIVQKGNSSTTELIWEVQAMQMNKTIEIEYQIHSNITGWQSIGVTKKNATEIYNCNYSCARYPNWRYYRTLNASDIWTNETPDVSILVKNPPVFEFALQPIMFIPAVVCAMVVVLRRKNK